MGIGYDGALFEANRSEGKTDILKLTHNKFIPVAISKLALTYSLHW